MTAIQWTDITDNIIVVVKEDGGGWWCRKISPGCAHCYSEDINFSTYFKGGKRKYSGEPPVLKLREDIIDGWARQRKPKKHFVASMTDVFGEWVPQSWIFRMLDGMRAAGRQTFQVLTKRAANMLLQVRSWLAARGLARVPSNIWLGVSVEDQQRADERIPYLLQIPGVLFLSLEPLLGEIDLCAIADGAIDAISGEHHPLVDWVIVGGESGKKARRSVVAWIRSIVMQCRAAGAPVFVKQLGTVIVDRNDAGFDGDDDDSWPTDTNVEPLTRQGDPVRVRTKHRKGGEILEWPTDLRVREFPDVECLQEVA